MRRTAVRNVSVVAAVLLSGLLAGETTAAVRNPDGVAVIIGNRAYKYVVPEVTYAPRCRGLPALCGGRAGLRSGERDSSAGRG